MSRGADVEFDILSEETTDVFVQISFLCYVDALDLN